MQCSGHSLSAAALTVLHLKRHSHACPPAFMPAAVPHRVQSGLNAGQQTVTASRAAAKAPQEAPTSQARALVMASPAAASAQQTPRATSFPAAPAGSAEEPPQPPGGRAEASQDPAARVQLSSAPHSSPHKEGRPQQHRVEQQQRTPRAPAPSRRLGTAGAEASSIAAGGSTAACLLDDAYGQAAGSQPAASQLGKAAFEAGKGQALASNERHLARPELIKDGSDSGDWVKLNGLEAEEAKQNRPQAADPRQQLRQLQNLRKLPEEGAATDSRAVGASFKSLSQYTQLSDLLREAPSAEQ